MVHEVNSPTVTNVIANDLPSILARIDSGSRPRRIADATSVSRTKLTPSRTGATHRGQQGTARTPHQSPTFQRRQDRPATTRVRPPADGPVPLSAHGHRTATGSAPRRWSYRPPPELALPDRHVIKCRERTARESKPQTTAPSAVRCVRPHRGIAHVRGDSVEW